MRVRRGWIALATLISVAGIAACGAPEVTDISNNGTGSPGGTNSPGGSGTPGGSPTGSGSGTPSGSPLPTVTNVPSYATWKSTVFPNIPSQCHSCHSGGAAIPQDPGSTDNNTLHYDWFASLCDFTTAGVQSYNPPTGMLVAFYCGQTYNGKTHGGGTVNLPTLCSNVKTWLAEHPATTPPSCVDGLQLGKYDLVNSK